MALRIKAVIVDMFMIYMPILYVITYVVFKNKEAFQDSHWGALAGVSAYGIIYAILISLKGQTPGKKAYGIKVVNNDDTHLSLIKALMRFVLFLMSCSFIVGIAVAFVRQDKKALHDLILGTKVIAT